MPAVAIGLAFFTQQLCGAGDSKDVFYLAIPRTSHSKDPLKERFAAVCARWPTEPSAKNKDKEGSLITAWRVDPQIPAYIHAPERGAAFQSLRNLFADKYKDIPDGLVTEILNALFAERSEASPLRFEPLFPLVQDSFWLQSSQVVAMALPSNDLNGIREANLIRQLETERNRKTEKASDLASRFREFCNEMGVPIKHVWYVPEVNIMIIVSNEDFGGLMEALFSVT